MALNSSFWQRNKFKLSGLVLILPFWFLYDAMTPEFPPAWNEQPIGSYVISPMPFDLKQPYAHHDEYVKDFLLLIKQGDIKNIRQGYVNIGVAPLPLNKLQQGDEGIVHGSEHGLHVHAIAPPKFSPGDKLWLTIQTWQGELLTTHWELPASLLSD